MWLSKQISKNESAIHADVAKLTISDGSQRETSGSATARNVTFYAPYGYCYCAPTGAEMLVLPSASGQSAIGARMPLVSLERGEVMITSLGGAKIVLKNDGSVVINGLVIDSKGVIQK